MFSNTFQWLEWPIQLFPIRHFQKICSFRTRCYFVLTKLIKIKDNPLCPSKFVFGQPYFNLHGVTICINIEPISVSYFWLAETNLKIFWSLRRQKNEANTLFTYGHIERASIPPTNIESTRFNRICSYIPPEVPPIIVMRSQTRSE
jgi:hypothetical protein